MGLRNRGGLGSILCGFLLGIVVLGPTTLRAEEDIDNYRKLIGYDSLVAAWGQTNIPTGRGVVVDIVEAGGESPSPDPLDPEFKNITFSFETPFSKGEHGTEVGWRFFGASSSIAPGIREVHSYGAFDWGGPAVLHAQEDMDPGTTPGKIQNHSWVWFTFGPVLDAEILRRLDFQINRDNKVVVVSVGNGDLCEDPQPGDPFILLAGAFNLIAVGTSAGTHVCGEIQIDGDGRTVPHIVAPSFATSYAAPMVSASAALLVEQATKSGWANGTRPQLIKAVLLAGATTNGLGLGWSHTPDQPLDIVSGAGQLNIHHSLDILAAGPQRSGAGSKAKSTGWSFKSLEDTGRMSYFFEVPPNYELGDFTATLTWNREISPHRFGATIFMADLDLYLREAAADENEPGPEINRSVSFGSNVEHIRQATLRAGRYQISVESVGGAAEYGLAWHGALRPIAPSLEISRGNDRNLLLKLTAFPGTHHVLEASEDLREWKEISDIEPGQTLGRSPSPMAQFFRVRQKP